MSKAVALKVLISVVLTIPKIAVVIRFVQQNVRFSKRQILKHQIRQRSEEASMFSKRQTYLNNSQVQMLEVALRANARSGLQEKQRRWGQRPIRNLSNHALFLDTISFYDLSM